MQWVSQKCTTFVILAGNWFQEGFYGNRFEGIVDFAVIGFNNQVAMALPCAHGAGRLTGYMRGTTLNVKLTGD